MVLLRWAPEAKKALWAKTSKHSSGDCRCWSICGSITGQGGPAGRSEYVGLCPLHEESQPSFYVNARKDVFYCHGCGQGGDLIRFVQLSRGLSFRQSLASLDPEITPEADSSAVLEQAAAFYQPATGSLPRGARLSRPARSA